MHLFFPLYTLTMALLIGATDQISLTEDSKALVALSSQHHEFFNNLSDTEKEWILKLSISLEGERLKLRRTGNGQQYFDFIRPYHGSTRDNYSDEIPYSVMQMMLNGEISQNFQEELIHWLKTDLGYEDTDFIHFKRNSNQFCKHPPKKCLPFKGVGRACCPFG